VLDQVDVESVLNSSRDCCCSLYNNLGPSKVEIEVFATAEPCVSIRVDFRSLKKLQTVESVSWLKLLLIPYIANLNSYEADTSA